MSPREVSAKYRRFSVNLGFYFLYPRCSCSKSSIDSRTFPKLQPTTVLPTRLMLPRSPRKAPEQTDVVVD